jgi:hypothetical protein
MTTWSEMKTAEGCRMPEIRLLMEMEKIGEEGKQESKESSQGIKEGEKGAAAEAEAKPGVGMNGITQTTRV